MNGRIKYPRLLLVMVGFVGFWLIVYRMTIANTLEIQREIAELSSTIKELRSTSHQQGQAPMHTEEYSMYRSDDFQTHFLSFLGTVILKNQVVIKSIEPTVVTAGDDIKIITQPIILQGEYWPLVKTLIELEKNKYGFEVASTRLFSVENRKTKSEQLYMKIYVQGIG